MSFNFSHLSDVELETLHKSLHGELSDAVKLQAHHLVSTELLSRGLDHGHNNDEYNKAVVDLGTSPTLSVAKAFDDMPSDVIESALAELDYPEFVTKTSLLTVDGYTLRFDKAEMPMPVDAGTMDMADMMDSEEQMLTETQMVLYEYLEAMAENGGKFNQSSDGEGAHYMEENPFKSQGIQCANCVFYEEGACDIVEGSIAPDGLCKFWIIPEGMLDESVLRKHMTGMHDQSTHGAWASEVGGLKAEDISSIHHMLKKSQIRESYNKGYDAGSNFATQVGKENADSQAKARTDLMIIRSNQFRDSTVSSYGNVHKRQMAYDLMTDIGFLEGLKGHKRRYRKNFVSAPSLSGFGVAVAKRRLRKHLAGQHDQSSHGNWAGHSNGGGTFNPDSYDWGYGSNRPSVQNKPDVVEFKGDPIVKGVHGLWNYLESDGKGGYKLTPERQKLHREIIAEHLKGVAKSSNPTFTMMGGGGGSGKGHIQETPEVVAQAGQLGVPLPKENSGQAVFIDADKIKAMLPDFDVFANNGQKEAAAGWTHEESSRLAKDITSQAYKRHLDVFLDGTGNSDASKLNKKINEARLNGYKVNGLYVTASIDLAWKQNMGRAVNNPKRGLVPPDSFLTNHKSISAIIPEMASKFDNFALFDTNHDTRPKGSLPPLVAHANLNGTIKIVNQKLWTDFINKASNTTTEAELLQRWDAFDKTPKKKGA